MKENKDKIIQDKEINVDKVRKVSGGMKVRTRIRSGPKPVPANLR